MTARRWATCQRETVSRTTSQPLGRSAGQAAPWAHCSPWKKAGVESSAKQRLSSVMASAFVGGRAQVERRCWWTRNGVRRRLSCTGFCAGQRHLGARTPCIGSGASPVTGLGSRPQPAFAGPFRTAHYFAPYGRACPAKTQGRTAVSPRLLIRMRAEVQVLPGPPSALSPAGMPINCSWSRMHRKSA